MNTNWNRHTVDTKYFDTLGVKEGSSFEQCQQAYRRLLRTWHPDRFPAGDPRRRDALQRLSEINHAFDRVRHILTRPSSAVPATGAAHAEQRRISKLAKLPTVVAKIN